MNKYKYYRKLVIHNSEPVKKITYEARCFTRRDKENREADLQHERDYPRGKK